MLQFTNYLAILVEHGMYPMQTVFEKQTECQA